MINSLIPTYMKDLASFFSLSYLVFDYYRASDMGKVSHFLVYIAEFLLFFSNKST